MTHQKITQADLYDMLVERFSEDPMTWAFTCPTCGTTTTGLEMRQALEANPRTRRDGEPFTASDILGQECIGRTLGALHVPEAQWKGPGCTWVAFGLFRGPWEVERPDGGSTWCFPVAEAAAAPVAAQ